MSALDPLPVTTAAPKERVAYLDNARYWVMLLVVIGHSLTQFVAMDSARGVYVWIYAFHMPFFILISGYTARRYMGDARQVRRIVSTLVVPYLIIEISMQMITRHYTGEPEPYKFLSPQWLGWFMAALFVWRLTTPIWRALRYPITTSIAISLLVGLIEVPNVLALPKILGFLPFYVIGLHMSRERFERLADPRIRVGSALLLAGSFVICYLYSANWTLDWLLWKQRYDEDPLGASPLEGITQRAELLVIGLVLTFAALSLVPRRRSWTTRLGGRTFYCYLLHGYVILLLRYQFGVFDSLEKYGAPAVVLTMVVATVVANLLMTQLVATVFRPVFEPRLRWLFRPDPETKPKSSKAPAPTA
ncbi:MULTISPECIES: acyltransferase family protein [unclassified Aeromicrobium]|jgi:fucose 4-O-acetylase-like acetyltransferase|uniref:acyltransferase family protein n=1 Tax=unclassified Aeromicrobium TaxID=2633570 RepID=UPI000A4A990E|nr:MULTISPECIES: acyltransferase family protein [unclassified Aeromicrobium]